MPVAEEEFEPSHPAGFAEQNMDTSQPKDQHFTIYYGDTGYSYEKLFGAYLKGAQTVSVEDSYIRLPHQIQNFIRFCELMVKLHDVKTINLVTGFDGKDQKEEIVEKFSILQKSLKEHGIDFNYKFSDTVHDREIRLDNGWIIKIGRGFDIYQKPEDWFSIGSSDFDLRFQLQFRLIHSQI
ncbi:MAG: hypothetical protein CL873_04335 [Dehalococcoidales bacterium]|nr:hypothetical protein [Dehalococcoidales bacterium]